MALVNWEIHGVEIGNCNCNWGCPCQFNSLPSHGFCEAFGPIRIDKGHFGKTQLDGLHVALLIHWPKAIHEGNGTMQVVIDERADKEQREALDAITHGRETREGATFFNVFTATCTKILPNLYKPIEFECDIDKRSGYVKIPGVAEVRAEPIKNPMTGAEHSVKVSLPNGFEFLEAQFASGSTTATGDIPLNLKDSHVHFCELHLGTNGVVN